MNLQKIRHFLKQKYAAMKMKGITPQQVLIWIGLGIFSLILLGVLSLGILVAVVSIGLPDVHDLDKISVAESTTIYDREGNVLHVKFGAENRQYMAYEQISPSVIDATIAIEDDKYWEHPGFNAMGILRAVTNNIFHLGAGGGGSTITQQYIKRTFLSPEKSFIRKLKELILAVQLEQAFDKKKILELYLNKIPYSNNAYGIEKAAEIYFNKHAKDLDLAESALLASIPQLPSYYNPFGPHLYSSLTKQFTDVDLIFRKIDNEADLRDNEFNRGLIGKNVQIGDKTIYVQGRSDLVLNRMLKIGYITEAKKDQAWQKIQNIQFTQSNQQFKKAQHFTFFVLAQLEEKYGKELVEQGGLKVYTTLDPNMQDIAEKAIKEGAEINTKNYNATNAALMAMDPKTGEILSMVGSKDYNDPIIDGKENVALDFRHPGSSFKPFVYAQAFYNRFGPGSVVYDTPIKFPDGKIPKNFDGKFSGRLTVRKALAQSRNIPAVKAYFAAGEQQPIIELAQKMGIHFQELEKDPNHHYGYSIALGGAGVRLFDMVSAFGAFANNGIRHDPVSILKVENAKGEILEEWKADAGQEVIDPQIAYLISSILSDTSVRLSQNLTVTNQINAAKSGTSDVQDAGKYYANDLWTMGYTTRLVAGVWAGNNNPKKDGHITGASADGVTIAAPIWKKFMSEALKDSPSEAFPRPAGIQEVAVSSFSGKLPGPNTPPDQIRSDLFASFSIPTEIDDSGTPLEIDTRNKEIANEFCPKEVVKTFTYVKVQDLFANDLWIKSATDWIQGNEPVATDNSTVVFGAPPVITSTLCSAENFAKKPSISIVSPVSGSSVLNGSKIGIQTVTIAPNGIVKVEFYLDGKFKYSTVVAPYNGEIRLPVGEKGTNEHIIMAKIYDSFGYTGEATITLTTAEQ